MRIELHPEARAEVHAAALWYEELNEGAGDELLVEIDAALERFAALPTSYPLWPGVPEREAPIRQGKINRFPYLVAFEVSGGVLRVHAIAHKRRKPLYWYVRAT